MIDEYEAEIIKIVEQQDWLMNLLKIVRDLKLPDWYIAAGAIRNTIWNYLHGFPTNLNQNDVDVIYFNPKDITPEADLNIWNELCKIDPNTDWNVFNQARAHIKNNKKDQQVYSTKEGISYYSEISNCVGVRLENNDDLKICAPHGLGDLMNLIVQPIPKPYQDLALYKERINKKRWDKIWPKLKITNI